MRFLDRFTRDEASAKVWWPLALLCVVALVASFPLGNRAADQARSDAAFRAGELSIARIEPLTSTDATTDLTPTLEALVASDPTLSAVRVWDAQQHTLVASSVRSDQIGSAEAMNDADIDAALASPGTWVVSDRLPTGDAGPVTFYAYTAIAGSGATLVTQFETADSTLLAGVHQFWLWFRITLGIAGLLLLALAGLSMREPVARIGANVPFYPESVPPWLAVMDVDRAVALEQAGDRAKDRLTGLQQRLDESERLRLKAEGELQQALAALGSGARAARMTTSSAPTRAAGAPRQPTPEAAAAAIAAAAASAKAAPKRRAKVPTPEPQPVVVPEPVAKRAEPVAKRPEPVAKRPEPAVLPAPPVADPVFEPAPVSEQVTVTADDVAVTAEPGPVEAEHDTGGWPEVVVLPDSAPGRHAASVGAGSSDSDAAVLDVLNRLVEPVEGDPKSEDATDMRARLARTAALKKPGSRERREERERGEQ